MTDVFSEELRHKVMSSIRSKNSEAEKIVFSYLNRQHVYYQKHYKRAPGTPDVALPRKKLACFIDGDFWHGRRLEELRTKRGEEDYWTKKIMRNIERDKQQRETLKSHGWQLLIIWETDILRKKTRNIVLDSICEFLTEAKGE